MSKRFFIALLLLLVINLIPIFYYLVRQSAELTENEEMVQFVFEKQVESILFSLNQESQNVLSQWINNLDIPVNYSGSLMQGIAHKLFANNLAIMQIEFKSLKNPNFKSCFTRPDETSQQYRWQASTLAELQTYLREDYQRIEVRRADNDLWFLFFLKSGNNDMYCTVRTRLDLMVEQNIRPKIQQAAQDLFVIAIDDSIAHKQLYITDESVQSEIKNRAESWYLPGIWFGIQLKTQTIEQLIAERSKTENYMLLSLFLLSISGSVVIILLLRKMLRMNSMKSDFIANVSHELRTPLSLIGLYSESLLLNRVPSEEKRMDYIQVIHNETNRLSDLVNRILSFSKIDKKKRIYQCQALEINSLVEEVFESYQPHFARSQVQASFVPGSDNLYVKADPEAMTECLANLIDNAIKYSHDTDRQIQIKLQKNGLFVDVFVDDNGIGISKVDQKHIFEKFFRVTHGDLAHKAKGAGLGLNIVKSNMKACGGKVSVFSELNKGSSFKLSFPLLKNIES
jgi:two-component system, OmpR family, phosphate regulon sensor histidine kinase PhoR